MGEEFGSVSGVAFASRPAALPRRPLSEVARRLGLDPEGLPPVMVSGLTLSTDRTRPGDLYAALPGTRAHGAAFVAKARTAGAVAVLTDPDGARMVGDELPVLVVDRPRAVLGRLAAWLYDEPAAQLRLVGVTGTQGKTTTTRLLEGALTNSHIPSAVIGTVGTRILGREVPSLLTTPEAPDLQALFAVMAEEGVEACAMEVSSHALVLGRVDGIQFDLACFLNLGRDHLDFHSDIDDYFAAKASLFAPDRAKRGLINVDDEFGRRLVSECEIPVLTFSAAGGQADWRALDVRLDSTGADFTVVGPHVEFKARAPLAGAFNVSNVLCALAAIAEIGYDVSAAADALAAGPGVPGRLESVETAADWAAIVDYAHKPDALEAALAALRPVTDGRLIVVFGAGGDRDHGKRPIMGEIASRGADLVIVTDDNPRTEDPAAIRAEILSGINPTDLTKVTEVDGRRAAIELAVSLATSGDTVLVAGKGHETGQEIAGVVHPFDDRAVLIDLIGQRR